MEMELEEFQKYPQNKSYKQIVIKYKKFTKYINK